MNNQIDHKDSSLYKNAIDLIECGIEDIVLFKDELDNDKKRRRYKTAIRNLYAGLLLLFKQKLYSLSPLAIAQNIEPCLNKNDEVEFKQAGLTTVNYQTIANYFKSLDIDFIKKNTKKLDRINKERNNIEHLQHTVSEKKLIEYVAESFTLIQNFMDKHLNLYIVDELKDKKNYDEFINYQDIYNVLLNECETTWNNFDSESKKLNQRLNNSFFCPYCDSKLIKFDEESNAQCMACSSSFKRNEYINKIVEEVYHMESYYAIKDGGEEAVGMCEECGGETFIVEDLKCALCGFSRENLDCGFCDIEMPVCELGGDNGYCSWCNQVRR